MSDPLDKFAAQVERWLDDRGERSKFTGPLFRELLLVLRAQQARIEELEDRATKDAIAMANAGIGRHS